MRLVTFNKWIGQRQVLANRNLRRLARKLGKPLFIVLQEAQNFDGTIPGYRAYRCTEQGLTSDDTYRAIVILVHESVRVKAAFARSVPGGDWVWKAGAKEARVWVRLVCELEGEVFEVWGGHRIPGGPMAGIVSNRKAWAAEHRFLVEWILRVKQKHPNRPIFIGADWNSHRDDNPHHSASLAELAHRVGGRWFLRGIDGFLVIAGRGLPQPPKRRRRVRKLLGKFGSDGHRPVVLDY